MTRLLRGWTVALPKAGELSRRQKLSGLVSMTAMAAFSWWLAQPVAASPTTTHTRTFIVIRTTYVHVVRSHFTTG